MIRKREKGFTLVLSLVLLLVMSLMGGSLVVISSSDHRANNSSDEYQQAFYVAETALLEAEKDLINSFLGSWTKTTKDGTTTIERDKDTKGLPPINTTAASNTACYKSFKNITQHGADATNRLQVVKHNEDISFYELIAPIFSQLTINDGSEAELEREETILEKYTYEYFMVNAGKAVYHEDGSSIASTAVDVINQGTAYKIYACGLYDEDEVIIALESVMVLPG